jgi:hypothetical protein
MRFVFEGRPGPDQLTECIMHGVLGVSRLFHIGKADTVDGLMMTLIDFSDLSIRAQ